MNFVSSVLKKYIQNDVEGSKPSSPRRSINESVLNFVDVEQIDTFNSNSFNNSVVDPLDATLNASAISPIFDSSVKRIPVEADEDDDDFHDSVEQLQDDQSIVSSTDQLVCEIAQESNSAEISTTTQSVDKNNITISSILTAMQGLTIQDESLDGSSRFSLRLEESITNQTIDDDKDRESFINYVMVADPRMAVPNIVSRSSSVQNEDEPSSSPTTVEVSKNEHVNKTIDVPDTKEVPIADESTESTESIPEEELNQIIETEGMNLFIQTKNPLFIEELKKSDELSQKPIFKGCEDYFRETIRARNEIEVLDSSFQGETDAVFNNTAKVLRKLSLTVNEDLNNQLCNSCTMQISLTKFEELDETAGNSSNYVEIPLSLNVTQPLSSINKTDFFRKTAKVLETLIFEDQITEVPKVYSNEDEELANKTVDVEANDKVQKDLNTNAKPSTEETDNRSNKPVEISMENQEVVNRTVDIEISLTTEMEESDLNKTLERSKSTQEEVSQNGSKNLPKLTDEESVEDILSQLKNLSGPIKLEGVSLDKIIKKHPRHALIIPPSIPTKTGNLNKPTTNSTFTQEDPDDSVYEDALQNVTTQKSLINQTIDEEVSAIVDSPSPDTSDTIEDPPSPIKAESTEEILKSCEAVIEKQPEEEIVKIETPKKTRLLRKQTQVIEVPMILKAAETKKSEEVDEMTKLRFELSELQNQNSLLEKSIVQQALEKQSNQVLLLQYKKVADNYQNFIAKQRAELVALKYNCEKRSKEFSNSEMAFSDAFEKYNRAKAAVEAFNNNQKILNQYIETRETEIERLEVQIEKLKKQVEDKKKTAAEKVLQQKQLQKQQLSRLESQVKRLEIKAASLETALKQKTDECQALAALCDDITSSKMG